MSSTPPSRRRAWRFCSRLAIAVGLLCAVSQWGLVKPGAAIMLVAVMASLVAASVRDDVGFAALPSILRSGVVTGLAAAAAVGLLAVFGVLGALVVAAILVTWPGLTSSVRVAWRAVCTSAESLEPAGAVVDLPPASPPQDLAALDDAALCRAWKDSFPLLRATRDDAAHLAVVKQREQYLDELQRRCPDGLATWLGAGARASDDPLPYLREQRPR